MTADAVTLAHFLSKSELLTGKMKYGSLFLLVVILLAAGKSRKVKGPEGTLWVSDSVFMDGGETTNLQYREYIYWLRNKYNDTEPYLVRKALPDTLVWRSFGSNTEELVETYFSHPEYNDYPVVGVSFRQAADYCKWRTDRLTEKLGKVTEDKKSDLAGITSVLFRLPTVTEWEKGARAGLDPLQFPYGYYGLNDTVHDVKVAVKKSYSAVVGMSYSLGPFPVRSNIPNGYGFFNMIGNVAEMTAQEGICKGGSWKNYLEECHISDSLSYSAPADWLGFRCVCVVRFKPGKGPAGKH